MSLFIVSSRASNPALATAIDTQFPEELSYRINDVTWVVSSAGTAKDVCGLLGIKHGGITGAFVFRTSNSYFGVFSSTFWDWVKARLEGEADA